MKTGKILHHGMHGNIGSSQKRVNYYYSKEFLVNLIFLTRVTKCLPLPVMVYTYIVIITISAFFHSQKCYGLEDESCGCPSPLSSVSVHSP